MDQNVANRKKRRRKLRNISKNKSSLIKDKENSIKDSFVYLIQQLNEGSSIDKSYYKVGISKNPDQRLSQLRTSNPFKLKLRLSYPTSNFVELEKMFLENFKRFRIRGEWLYLYDDLVEDFLADLQVMEVDIENILEDLDFLDPQGCNLYYLLKTKYTMKNMMPSEILKQYKQKRIDPYPIEQMADDRARKRIQNEKNGILTLEGEGKCEGRKSHKEINSKLVALVKKLRRQNWKTKKVMSLKRISDYLFSLGYVNERGNPYHPESISRMLDQ